MLDESTETLLTDGALTQATAAAKAAVPGATPQRVETDAEGAAYEVHMVRSDGTLVASVAQEGLLRERRD